jgi:hypothetical protein
VKLERTSDSGARHSRAAYLLEAASPTTNILELQATALRVQPARDTVAYEEAESAAKELCIKGVHRPKNLRTGFAPSELYFKEWSEFTHAMSLADEYPVFVGVLKGPHESRRIVAVRCFGSALEGRIITVGSDTRPPTLLPRLTATFKMLNYDESKQHLKVYVAHVDPRKPDTLLIPFDIDGQRGEFFAQLGEDEIVHFRANSGPATLPASSYEWYEHMGMRVMAEERRAIELEQNRGSRKGAEKGE